MHFPTRCTLALAAALVAACDGAVMTAAPDSGVHAVGILAWVAAPAYGGASSPQTGSPGAPRPGVTAPDTVQAGVAFPVVVTTVGPTVCWMASGAQVDMQQPGIATITPFDFTPEDHWTACGDALVELPRTVIVTFPQPGEAALRVQGRRVVGGNFQAEERVVLEKKIYVRGATPVRQLGRVPGWRRGRASAP
jgi:hypothetical protein